MLVTAFQRRANIFTLGGRAPIGRGSYSAMIREADEYRFLSNSFANHLSDVHFTVMTHLGGTRVAQVGIVRPDNRFRLPASIKVRNQIADRVHHVPVAQVPRRRAAAKHRAVVLLRVFYQPRILFCKKQLLRRHIAVAA